MFKAIIRSLISILNDGSYTNITINNTILENNFSDYEKKLYTKIVYGVVENKILLDYLIQPFIKGKRVKPYLKNALRVGVYGIDFLNTKDHFIVNNLVEEVKRNDYKGSTFLNAILRRYQISKRRNLPDDKLEYLSVKYSINLELVKLLYEQYPNKIEEILLNEDHKYNTYLINPLKISVDKLKKELEKYTYKIENNWILEVDGSLINTNLFKTGCIMPQDRSSIEVGLVLNPQLNSSILDCCSAPGSKSMHLGMLLNNTGKIVSGDIYQHKIDLINEAKKRLGITCVNTIIADATNYDYNEKFDYILADVPCSGLGVIHHKPDLKYQMSLEKIESIKKIQNKIINNVINYLKPGGILVYSTCTINLDENERFIEKFLKDNQRFIKQEEIKYLPNDFHDGFYICKLKEITNE